MRFDPSSNESNPRARTDLLASVGAIWYSRARVKQHLDANT
jgi:hypothetical protein